MLITQIRNPQAFNAGTLAQAMYASAREASGGFKCAMPIWEKLPEDTRQRLIDAAQYTLDYLVDEGILATE